MTKAYANAAFNTGMHHMNTSCGMPNPMHVIPQSLYPQNFLIPSNQSNYNNVNQSKATNEIIDLITSFRNEMTLKFTTLEDKMVNNIQEVCTKVELQCSQLTELINNYGEECELVPKNQNPTCYNNATINPTSCDSNIVTLKHADC